MLVQRTYQFGDVADDHDLIFAENRSIHPPELLVFFPKDPLTIPLASKEYKRNGEPKKRAKRKVKPISVIHLEGQAAEAMKTLYDLSVADEEIDYRWLIDFLKACFLCGVKFGIDLAIPPSILKELFNLGEETLPPEKVPPNFILFLRQGPVSPQKGEEWTHSVFLPNAPVTTAEETLVQCAWFEFSSYAILGNLTSALTPEQLSSLLLNIFVAGEGYGRGDTTAAMQLPFTHYLSPI